MDNSSMRSSGIHRYAFASGQDRRDSAYRRCRSLLILYFRPSLASTAGFDLPGLLYRQYAVINSSLHLAHRLRDPMWKTRGASFAVVLPPGSCIYRAQRDYARVGEDGNGLWKRVMVRTPTRVRLIMYKYK